MLKYSLNTTLKYTAVVVLPLLYAASAMAQTPASTASVTPAGAQLSTIPDVAARKEIIYRANLGRADDVKLLISQGGSPNQLDGAGTPILSMAATRKDSEGKNVVATLLTLGADINARDHKGQNALFYAAKGGSIDNAIFLMENKIDIDALDNNGDTARTVAFTTGHKDIVQAIDTFISRPIAPAPPADPTPVAPLPPVTTTVPPNVVSPPPASSLTIVPVTPATITSPSSSDTAAISQHEKELEAQLEELKKNTPTREDMKRMADELVETNKKLQLEHDKVVSTSTSQDSNILQNSSVPVTGAVSESSEQKQKEIEQLNSDLAFNTCGYQYWYFCSDVKQSTEFDSEELTVSMTSHKTKVENLRNTLLKKYSVNANDYSVIVDSAQQRIYNQLVAMQSNQDRHEAGVGKMDDMLLRCGEIGRQWAVDPPGIVRPRSDSDSKTATGGAGKGINTNNSNKRRNPNSSSNTIPSAQDNNSTQSVRRIHPGNDPAGGGGGSGVMVGGAAQNTGGGGNYNPRSGNQQGGGAVQPPLQEVPSNNSIFK